MRLDVLTMDAIEMSVHSVSIASIPFVANYQMHCLTKHASCIMAQTTWPTLYAVCVQVAVQADRNCVSVVAATRNTRTELN